jgi:hypothetical protein
MVDGKDGQPAWRKGPGSLKGFYILVVGDECLQPATPQMCRRSLSIGRRISKKPVNAAMVADALDQTISAFLSPTQRRQREMGLEF